MARIEYEGVGYGAGPDETLLDALLRQGVVIGHSCRKGSCGCCQLRLVSGEIRAMRVVDPSLQGDGHVLACVSAPVGDVVLAAPELGHRPMPVELVAREWLAPDIVALELAPLHTLDFRAGQHVHLIRDDGLSRPYSIASLPGEGYTFRIHVRRIAGGAMSGWLCDELRPGQRLQLRGPAGDACYHSGMRERPLLLMATGTGAGAMLAVLRDALDQGHSAPIRFYHGVRDSIDLYLDATTWALAERHPNLRYIACVTGDRVPPGARAGRVVESVLADLRELGEHEIFLCGLPAMVEEARVGATRAGAQRDRIHADPFEFAAGRPPGDAGKIATLAPDRELWEALGRGPALTRILEDFYRRVFEDERLSPFFQGISRDWVVQKQYEFLASLFSGESGYFGMNPYNAHHWMVISDELFDYRESLFERVVRDHGLDEALIRRWLAVHELFRAEIVKALPRGLYTGGVERPHHAHVEQCLEIDALCDGCGGEIPAGMPSRYQYRAGSLFCAHCAGIATGA